MGYYEQSIKKVHDLFFLGIEDLCTKRDELHRQILTEEEEKRKIQNDIRILTERLAKITESLSKKYAAQTEYDRTISETETAYMKVIDKFHCFAFYFCKNLRTLEAFAFST